MRTSPTTSFLNGYPQLASLVDQLSAYLESRHPTYFGVELSHPFLPAKRSKVIHDNLWGTARFSWRELALIDSPVMQRLRDVHQTGLAYHVYPSARHTRFEHSLGATTIASRVFDALLQKQRDEIKDLLKSIYGLGDADKLILRAKQELRLAALLHDTGHCLYSHTSERVYEKLEVLRAASAELTSFVGKEKGAGEVISFCLALTPALGRLLARVEGQLIGDKASDDYEGPISLVNVALIIVGRAQHPFLQFLGDIISSGFDADKLDYLLRDARTAGLPLSYDIDRYLYDVRIEKETLPDDRGALEKLYQAAETSPQRKPAAGSLRFPYYDTYRLRLSRRAMNVIEQIMICKMMLFSYIYHHPKVRAAEGLLQRWLDRKLGTWRAKGIKEPELVNRFLDMTDGSLRQIDDDDDDVGEEYRYRLVNRLLPREVYSISGPSATHASAVLIEDFLVDLHDRSQKDHLIRRLETAIGTELVKLEPKLGSSPEEAIARAGVWVDAPKPPSFEGIDDMVLGTKSASSDVPLMQIFPIREWTQAYEHYRYQIRVFAFSEYWQVAAEAAKVALKDVINISSDSFYDTIRRDRP